MVTIRSRADTRDGKLDIFVTISFKGPVVDFERLFNRVGSEGKSYACFQRPNAQVLRFAQDDSVELCDEHAASVRYFFRQRTQGV
jgi:hypothetical protein